MPYLQGLAAERPSARRSRHRADRMRRAWPRLQGLALPLVHRPRPRATTSSACGCASGARGRGWAARWANRGLAGFRFGGCSGWFSDPLVKAFRKLWRFLGAKNFQNFCRSGLLSDTPVKAFRKPWRFPLPRSKQIGLWECLVKALRKSQGLADFRFRVGLLRLSESRS